MFKRVLQALFSPFASKQGKQFTSSQSASQKVVSDLS